MPGCSRCKRRGTRRCPRPWRPPMTELVIAALMTAVVTYGMSATAKLRSRQAYRGRRAGRRRGGGGWPVRDGADYDFRVAPGSAGRARPDRCCPGRRGGTDCRADRRSGGGLAPRRGRAVRVLRLGRPRSAQRRAPDAQRMPARRPRGRGGRRRDRALAARPGSGGPGRRGRRRVRAAAHPPRRPDRAVRDGGTVMLSAAACLSVTAGLAVTAFGVFLVRRRLAVVEVAGPSMQPALSSGDRVLVRRARMSELRSGLVVVVERPRPDGGWVGAPPSWPPGQREWLIKRVAALPGDRRPADVPPPGSDPDDAV